MSKCIIFSRVSTDKQDLDQQTEKLMSKARSCGHKDSDFVIIGQHESGVKLSTEQREGVQKIYRAIWSKLITFQKNQVSGGWTC